MNGNGWLIYWLGIAVWAGALPVPAQATGVTSNLQITEFMAVNQGSLVDEDGEASGWIEIYNPTAGAISLTGWSLTSQATNLVGWRFPNYTLLAKDYLVVFASGKNRTNVTGTLHTNFKLTAGGGFLALVDPRTNLVSSFAPAYPPQFGNISYGRDPLLPDRCGYFTVSTPGKRNATVGPGFSPEVGFSRRGGTFTAPFQLQLASPVPDAVIRYTIDGTLPSDASPVYAGPLTVANSTRVRARAFLPGLMPGPIHSEYYLWLNAGLVNVTSDLPAVVIHNFGVGAVPTATSQPVNLSLYEQVNGKTSLTNAPSLSLRAGIHLRGSSTLGLPKAALAVTFWDDFNANLEAAPLGLPPGSHWVLYAPDNFEPVLIHNPLIYQLSNEVGRYAPRTRLVEVYLNTSGGALLPANYNGIYVLEEKIERAADRVAIDKLHTDDNLLPNVTGGYLMKIDRLGSGETGFSAAGQTIVYVDPPEAGIKTPERGPQRLYLQTYFNAFSAALNGANYKSPTLGYPAYVDVDSWIDHHLLNVVSLNVDALRLSTFFYKPRGGKIFFGPIWDFDRSQGSADGRDFNPRVWSSAGGTDYFQYPWWNRLFTDLEFYQKWIDRYEDLRRGVLSTNHIFAVIDNLTGQVRRQQPREAARWPGFTTPRSGTIAIGGYSYRFPGTYQGEIDFLKQWYSDRLNFIDTNFLAKPSFSPAGGPLTAGLAFSLAGPAGATLYYCTDGSDPRLTGGVISPKAQVYLSPVHWNQNAMMVARAYDPRHRNPTGSGKPPLSSTWSGATTVTFGFVTSPAWVAYSAEGAEYTQNFDGLPTPGQTTVDAANPVTLNGSAYALTSPFGLAIAAAGPGAFGGLGLANTLSGWYGLAALKAKVGASAGDQSTGGMISFGLTNSPAASTNRALGLLATSSTGPTAFGIRFVNATSQTLNRMDLAFTGELWRQAAIAKRLTFSYFIDEALTNALSTNATAFLTNLDVQFPALAAATTPVAVDGTAPANQVHLAVTDQVITNWAPGAALWLVWQMSDPAGKGQGLAIDDLTFSAHPAAPSLSIQRSGPTILISWPTNSSGYVLESNSSLDIANGWSPATEPVVTTNGAHWVTASVQMGSQFFRLRR